MIRERDHGAIPGLPVAVLLFVVLAALVYALVVTVPVAPAWRTVVTALTIVFDVLLFTGLFVVNPNEGGRRPASRARSSIPKAASCSSSVTTSARRRPPACAGRTRSTRRNGFRCACATSRARI